MGKRGPKTSTHRVSYEHFKGPVPSKDVLEIRDLLKAKVFTQVELGRLYDISQPKVSEIKRGDGWFLKSEQLKRDD